MSRSCDCTEILFLKPHKQYEEKCFDSVNAQSAWACAHRVKAGGQSHHVNYISTCQETCCCYCPTMASVCQLWHLIKKNSHHSLNVWDHTRHTSGIQHTPCTLIVATPIFLSHKNECVDWNPDCSVACWVSSSDLIAHCSMSCRVKTKHKLHNESPNQWDTMRETHWNPESAGGWGYGMEAGLNWHVQYWLKPTCISHVYTRTFICTKQNLS